MQPLRRVALLLCLTLALPAAAQPKASCAEKDKPLWRTLKERKGVPEAGTSVDSLALSLVPCLGSPDPEVRDGLAYELLTSWMRAGALSDATLHSMTRMLIDQLDDGLGEVGKETVFRRAFSALVLSEVIRRDTLQPFLTPEEASGVLTAAARYMEGERDRRGFSDSLGWMHGVAHGADLLWRLAMSPRMKQPELERVLQAIAAQVAPSEHAYIHNEGDRLARVVVAVMHRGLVPPAAFERWLQGVATPKGMASWAEVFRSEKGLTQWHNAKQFLRALHSQLLLGKTAPPAKEQLLPHVVSALEKVSFS